MRSEYITPATHALLLTPECLLETSPDMDFDPTTGTPEALGNASSHWDTDAESPVSSVWEIGSSSAADDNMETER